MTSEAPVRALLRRTWFPFFGRFGRLTEVQTRAIPELMRGANVTIISPSASGKTEAAGAPIVERLLDRRDSGGLSVLYVSPTRALVNDLYRRLCGPMEYLGLTLARKTGDHPTIRESSLPFMLITTPESFDSLLCRHTAIFRDVGAVILDELHLLDNTPRGDQLRLLLERLRLVAAGSRASGAESREETPPPSKGLPARSAGSVQYCALSATIDDRDIGARYFPDPRVIEVDSCREVENVLLEMDEDWHARVVGLLRARGCRKVLCFFNSRAGAEQAVPLLDIAPFRERVWVHHASLHRKVREEVEARMNTESSGILCCTSTLELGIDIGDIDAVVLARPPFSVSSLLQRVGRGNRRRGELFAVGLYVDKWERFLFEAFFDCCRKGTLYEKRYLPSLAVIPQQVASYLYQRRRVGATLSALRRVFEPVYKGSGVVERVFHHLLSEAAVAEARPGIYFLGPKLERQTEYGHIHSNIQNKTFGKYEVFDSGSHRHLGTVFHLFRTFVLGGRVWELVEFREKEGRIMVRPSEEVGAATKVFEGTGTIGYGFRMARALKARLFPALAEDEFPWFREAGHRFIVHLLGTTYGYLLTEAFALEGRSATDLDGKLLSVPVEKEDIVAFPLPAIDSIRAVVRKNLARFEDSLGSGAFFRLLPLDLREEDHLLALDVQGLLDFLAHIRLVEMPPAQVAAAMQQP